MPKVLTISGMVVAGLLLALFILDMALGIPFNKASMAMDVGFVICALALAYLSFSAFRELK